MTHVLCIKNECLFVCNSILDSKNYNMILFSTVKDSSYFEPKGQESQDSRVKEDIHTENSFIHEFLNDDIANNVFFPTCIQGSDLF